VIARDEGCCRACGAHRDLLVHHRRPPHNELRWLAALCRSCHTRLHRTLRLRFGFPAELRLLWREAHPGLAEQLDLSDSVTARDSDDAWQWEMFSQAA
jgi:hypothetical protein